MVYELHLRRIAMMTTIDYFKKHNVLAHLQEYNKKLMRGVKTKKINGGSLMWVYLTEMKTKICL